LVGNHFRAFATQAPYTQPAPTPPVQAARYSMASELISEYSTQDRPHRAPPTMTRGREPYLSMNTPASGTSQVCTTRKMVKEISTAGVFQLKLLTMGPRNRGQAYCRLAMV